MRMVAAISGGLKVQVGWLGLRVGGRPALSLHSSNEPGELSQWLCHDDSTINIISVIIIIIIVIKLFVNFSMLKWSVVYLAGAGLQRDACLLADTQPSQ